MMTDPNGRQHRSILQRIAHRAMLQRGLVPDFPPQALAELDRIHGPATQAEKSTRDQEEQPSEAMGSTLQRCWFESPYASSARTKNACLRGRYVEVST